jgi:hypothetical protein
MEDIDAPFEKPILHCVALFDPTIEMLLEGALTVNNTRITFIPGRKGRLGYHGPRPQWGQPYMAPPKAGSPQLIIFAIFSITT